MERWEQVAAAMWDAVLARARVLKTEEGYTYQQLADLLGLSHRAKVSDWLHGHQQAVNATFADLMRYVERLGLDYRKYFPAAVDHASLEETPRPVPASSDQVAALTRRVEELEVQVRELERYKAKWEGHLEELAVVHGQKDTAKPGT